MSEAPRDPSRLVRVRAWECPYDPREMGPVPLGMFHCDRCGCMVLASEEHGACLPTICPAADEGWHPGPEIVLVMTAEEALWMGAEVLGEAPAADPPSDPAEEP